MKVLVYLKTLSRFSMAKDRSGKFTNVRVRVGPEFFSGLLYKGRPLTVAEFNEEFPSVMYPRNRKVYGGARVLVRIVNEDELSEESFDLEDEEPERPEEEPENADADEKGTGIESQDSGPVADSPDPFIAKGPERAQAQLETMSKGEIAEKVYNDKGVSLGISKNKSAVIKDAVAVYFPSLEKEGEIEE